MKQKNTHISIMIFTILLISHIINAQQSIQSEIRYEITKYEIGVKIPDTYDNLEVKAALDIKKIAPDPKNNLKIMLCRYFRGIKPINIKIFDEYKEPLDFAIHDDVLSITMSNHFEKGETKKIVIQYNLVKNEEFYDKYTPFACEISNTLCHINAAITRTDNWYPKIEGTMHRRLPEFHLFIDVPAQFEVMASGKLIDVLAQGDREIFEWQNYEEITDRSLYFFAQQQKRIIKKYPKGFKVIMYVPDEALEENITYIADVIYKSYNFFEDIYGAVPGNEYKIMAFPYAYSGLLNAMTAPISFFTQEIIDNEVYYPTRSIIHEVSHTWWGNLISSNAEENYWLYEGFAKYSETIGIKEVVDDDVEMLSFLHLKLASMPYLDNVPSILDAGKEENRTLENVAAYYMGATYLKMLEFIMGKKNFYRAIRDYVKTYRGKCISTANFIEIMKKHCDVDIHGILSDYLTMPGYARYTIEKIRTVNKGCHYLHTFAIKNTGDRDIYSKLKVQSDMENYTKRFFIAQNESFTIKVKSKQQKDSGLVVIDPDQIFPVYEEGLKSAGGMVYTNGKGEVKFFDVIENTPLSNAGIKNNMILLKVDGKNLSDMNLRELNYMFLRRQGTHLTLLVREEEEEPYEIITSF